MNGTAIKVNVVNSLQFYNSLIIAVNLHKLLVARLMGARKNLHFYRKFNTCLDGYCGKFGSFVLFTTDIHRLRL